MKQELLILELHIFRGDWLLKDCSGQHISTFDTRKKAEAYAQENNYRLKIHQGAKVEYFTPTKTV